MKQLTLPALGTESVIDLQLEWYFLRAIRTIVCVIVEEKCSVSIIYPRVSFGGGNGLFRAKFGPCLTPPHLSSTSSGVIPSCQVYFQMLNPVTSCFIINRNTKRAQIHSHRECKSGNTYSDSNMLLVIVTAPKLPYTKSRPSDHVSRIYSP